MHLVSRLRRILAMMIVLLGLLAGLGVASAQADAPVLTGGGGRQTPRVAKQTTGTLPSNATSTPPPTPSPIQATTPLSPTASPNTPSSTTSTPDNTNSASAKPSDNMEDQASHIVRFDPDNASTPTQSTVKTGTLATPPIQNPVRDDFRFDGWTHDGQPFDFRTPILQDTTLKAKWAKATDWTLSPDHGPATGARLTIKPPSLQEPHYVNVQGAGEQLVGLTGDGRIYTWTQDGTPKQVPLPVQSPEGFHYLQATTGSRWQAALGSDQHIYTWTSQQPAPIILDTVSNSQFTSISTNDDLLLAVDRQGRIHAFRTGLTGSKDLNPKPAEQATTGLPGQTQAVTAVASDSRILALDSEGQAWTWETSNTGKTKPERIRQDPGIRILQAQALDQGFLLLDADGQARHLADSTTSLTAVGLPEDMRANRITGNGDQAVITGTNGQVWAWQPGKAPMRADNGNQHYMQAAEADSRIMALDRQGSMFTWSLDHQSNPGKTSRVDTSTASTLESASLDGQPLKLSEKDESWQVDIPARKPGPAAITLAGRQDGRPFTRSLNYTVDQPLTRDTETETGHTVHFNTDAGSPEPEDQTVPNPYGRVQRPSPNPERKGYQFDGWFIGEVAYDFSKPVTKDLTLTAHWTPTKQNNQWSISPDKGNQLGNEATTITPPDTSRGIRFSQISGSNDLTYGFSLAVGSDGNAYAWGSNSYGRLGDGTATQRTTPVLVKKPDRKTYPDLPEDFTYMQVSAGDYYSLAVGSDGYVYAWGYNSYGQLGNNSTSSSYVPVRVRDPDSPNDASKGLKATQVSAGQNHSLAVGSDGYAYAWGDGSYGKLGNYSTSSSSVPVRVRDPASPTDTSKGLKAAQISAGYGHSLAVGSDGYAYAWGLNDYYHQLGNNSSSNSSVPVRVRDPDSPNDASKGLKATQVSAGQEHSLAVDKDGNAYAWGDNDNGQLGIKGSGRPYPYPMKVLSSAQSTSAAGPWMRAVQITAGDHHSLAIGTDGNTKAWGSNRDGRLGDGTTNTKWAPVPVAFNLQPVISAVRFDTSAGTNLTHVSNSNSVTVTTPAHQPGPVKVSVDYTMGGVGSTLTDKSLTYTYTPLGVLPQAGGEGILLALATGMTGMGGVLASRRHRRETHRLLHASHE
ncbi:MULTISPECIES: InlB B-repeat-containing protein [Bifidobacterium]|uniref:RCC1 domain-containing protein n=1 Tax=Bifidobacterium TaxID=1678 RepID=UPI0018DE3979|nr:MULTISPECIES: InlB B-repeat-containing protein [Bifidobacterium]MBH9980258.1 InlB B-repeat-containing protein [Bifidobacterium asteroides]MBI0099919.1 InlB B-repeat-containing protein [Bifidobacterium sp. W8114]